MPSPTESVFSYVIYMRASSDAIWRAFIDPDQTPLYWFGARHVCDWTKGASWKLVMAEDLVVDTGEVVEIEAGKHLTLHWRHAFQPELTAEGVSTFTLDLKPEGAATQVSIRHTMAVTPSAFIAAVSDGWPKILSNLKSLLETGAVAF